MANNSEKFPFKHNGRQFYFSISRGDTSVYEDDKYLFTIEHKVTDPGYTLEAFKFEFLKGLEHYEKEENKKYQRLKILRAGNFF
jgi:hypothetical protein